MISNLQFALIEQNGNGIEELSNARKVAGKLFERMHGRGVRNQLKGILFGKSNSLQVLSYQSKAACRSAGVVFVPLSKIVGSEGRSEDFDAAFNPLKRHNRDRWVSIAAARWAGVVLPVVELVQAGNDYFVRDGHHRISVAKAMGQLEIEARIVN